MTITPSYEFHTMYHADLPPREVQSQAECDALTEQGWTKEYQHQPFPSHRYNEGGDFKIVKDAYEAKAAAKDGFSLTEPPERK